MVEFPIDPAMTAEDGDTWFIAFDGTLDGRFFIARYADGCLVEIRELTARA